MSLLDSIIELGHGGGRDGLSPWFLRRLKQQVTDGLFPGEEELEETGSSLIREMRDIREQAGVDGAVLALSGRAGSALAAALLARAGWRVIGCTFSMEEGATGATPDTAERGLAACDALGIEHRHLDLTASCRTLAAETGGTGPSAPAGEEALLARRAGLRAQLRLLALQDQAIAEGGIVARTGSLSERGAGLEGGLAGAGDLAPVQSLLLGWEIPWLARRFGLPETLWRVEPGAEPWGEASTLEWDVMVFAVMEALFMSPGQGADRLPALLDIGGDGRARQVLDVVLRRLDRGWLHRAMPVRLRHPSSDRLGRLNALDRRLFRPAALRREEDLLTLPSDIAYLAERLVQSFTASGDRLVTAESCTSGLIGASVAPVSGSAAVFEGGFVTYRTDMKTDALGVSSDLLREKTPYHPDVARAMAEGALRLSARATVALAVTGVGGPGPDCGKPAGLVYIAIARRGAELRVEEHHFAGTPQDVLADTIRTALLMALSPPRGTPRVGHGAER
ncbi:CinA family protein [Azospirillum sp. SYSU D00513]|uniref:CinA family protein n=1 Tax=Azospirillum sp. SYSU D00513 TaxID=2812561 RepID=UPI001A95A9B1|nr:CinA family protein [Azospirillum sp. SYSU D00513]